jgi:integrase
VRVPNYSRVYFVGWDRFPASLVQDVEAHLTYVAGTDILSDLDVRPLKPGSLKTRRQQLGAYLSGLVLSGEDPSALHTLADAVALARVRKGLHFFLGRAENGSTAQAYGIARVLLSVARHWVKAPNAQIEQMQAFCKRLETDTSEMTEKNRKRLRQFDDEASARDLVSLPAKLLRKAKQEEGPATQQAALWVQTAVAVELLLMVPIRRENLTRPNLQRHIDRRRNGKAYLCVPGREVKNGVEIEAELPPETVKLLDLYMKSYQPLLAEKGSPWLFPGLPGRPKSRERMAFQISETIKKEIGLEMHTHLFRHFAAKFYLDRNPGGYGVVQKLHGHKSMQTTIRSYCGAERKSAVAHYDRQILELRHKRPEAPRRKGR